MASKDKSNKKNVFELKTRQGTELLIQSDSDTVINDWFNILSSTISNQTVEPNEAIKQEIRDSPGIEKHDKEKDQKEPKKLRCKFFFPSFASGLSELIILLALQSFKVNM